MSRPGQSGGLSLYDRIGYATDVEADALQRLSALDVAGCRSRFGQFVEVRITEALPNSLRGELLPTTDRAVND